MSDKFINIRKWLDELEKLEQEKFPKKKITNLTTKDISTQQISQYGYIYLIREREFLLRDEDVYKVGATVQKHANLQIKRLYNYKKGSQLLCVCICDYDCVFNVESNIKQQFRKKFQKHIDGNEYFIGDPNVMLRIIYNNLPLINKKKCLSISNYNKNNVTKNINQPISLYNDSVSLEADHNFIAYFLAEKYKFVYKCASINDHIWYKFENHKWDKITAQSLTNLIIKELIEYRERLINLYNSQKQQEHEKNMHYIDVERFSKVLDQFNKQTFINKIICQYSNITYDPNFLKNLDENIHLICFKNGIYDLETNSFRNGNPDDYVSLCTNYEYIEYDKNDENCNEIKSFIKKIQPDKVMRKYLMILLSTCLSGSNKEENFYVFTGSGTNGKSKLMELMEHTLGELYKPMDIDMLVGKKNHHLYSLIKKELEYVH